MDLWLADMVSKWIQTVERGVPPNINTLVYEPSSFIDKEKEGKKKDMAALQDKIKRKKQRKKIKLLLKMGQERGLGGDFRDGDDDAGDGTGAAHAANFASGHNRFKPVKMSQYRSYENGISDDDDDFSRSGKEQDENVDSPSFRHSVLPAANEEEVKWRRTLFSEDEDNIDDSDEENDEESDGSKAGW